MGTDVGLKLSIGGEAAFKSSLQAINSQIRNLNSEMKAVISGFTGMDSAEEKSASKMGVLSRQLDTAKQKLSILENEYKKQRNELGNLETELSKATNEFGKNSAEAARAEKKYNDQARVVNNLGRQINDTTTSINKIEKEMKDVADGTDKATHGFEEASKSASNFGDILKGNIAADLVVSGIRKITNELLEFGKYALEAGMNFESQMSKVQAISGASTGELEALTGKAKEMGKKTVFSATESAQALEYMAMAGWKTDDMLGGLEGIMNLAAASGEELAGVSDIVTDALTAFGLSAKESGRFADVLAAASSNSNTNVGLMGQTFQYAAPVAGALGYSIEDTAVAIGLMANAGIKGDKAGTALRSTLTRLSAPPKECATAMDKLGISLTETDGTMKPLSKVITELRGSFKGLSEIQQTQAAKAIAGKEAMTGLLAIVNASDSDFSKLTTAIQTSNGAAEGMAKTMTDNLKGSITLAGSAVEGMATTLYERFAPQMKEAVDWFAQDAVPAITDFISAIIDNKDTLINAITIIGAGFAAFELSPILIPTAKAFIELTTATDSATAAMKGLNVAMESNPAGLLIAAIGALVGVFIASQREINKTSKEMQKLEDEWANLKEQSNETAAASIAQIEHAADLSEKLKNLTDETGRVSEANQGYAESMYNLVNETLPGYITKTGEGKDAVYEFNGALEDTVEQLKLQAIAEAYKDDYQEALSKRVKNEEKLQEALAKRTEAEKEYNTYSTGPARNAAKQRLDDAQKEVDTYSKLGEQYENTIQNFENLDTARAANDFEKAQQSAAALTGELKNISNLSMEDLRKELKDVDKAIQDAKSALDNTDLNEGQRNYLNRHIENLKSQKLELKAQMKENAIFGVEGYAEGLSESETTLVKGSERLNKSVLGGLEIKDKAKKKGSDGASGLKEGINSAKSSVVETTKDLVAEVEKTPSGLPNAYEKVGADTSQGLANGLRVKMAAVKKAAQELAEAAKEAIKAKSALDVHSPSKWAEGIGEFVGEGLGIGLRKTKKARAGVAFLAEDTKQEMISAFEKMSGVEQPAIRAASQVARSVKSKISDTIDKLNSELENEKSKASEASAKKELEEHKAKLEEKNKALHSIKKKDAAKAKAEKEKIQKEIAKIESDWNTKKLEENRKAAEQQVKDQVSSLEKLRSEYEKQLEAIEKKEESLSEKMKGYGDLLKSVKDNETGKEIFKLGDLNEQIEKITEYGNALEKLKEKGAPESLLNEITSMSIDDATRFMDELDHLSSRSFDEYLKKWDKKQQLSEEIANKFYQGQYKAVNDEFATKIPKGLNSLTNDMKDVGKNAVSGMKDGMLGGLPDLLSTARSIAQDIVNEMRSELDIHSPSKKTGTLIGIPMAQGIVKSFRESMSEAQSSMGAAIMSPLKKIGSKDIYSVAEGVVNGMAVAGTSGTQTVIIPINLDGRQIARAVFDPLKDESKIRGENL